MKVVENIKVSSLNETNIFSDLDISLAKELDLNWQSIDKLRCTPIREKPIYVLKKHNKNVVDRNCTLHCETPVV